MSREKKLVVQERIQELADAATNDDEVTGLQMLAEELAEPPVLRVKPLRAVETAQWTTAYNGDAGLDLAFNPADGMTRIVRPWTVEMIETGVAVAIPDGHAGLVLPRSGVASKFQLAPINSPGLIDSGYRGELIVALANHGAERQTVSAGQRIAQLVVVPVMTPRVELVEELDETERGGNGFGSSGS